MAVLKIAVLISGRGSNMQALIDAGALPGYPAEISCVISNDPMAKGLERATAARIPALVVNHRDFGKDRQAFEAALDAKLQKYGVQLVCLAGFMRILTPWFVERWHDRLINIHPSLLPSFPGLDTHRKALEYGARFAGCTVHYVRAEMDHGPIIIQAAVPILPDDTEDTLAARVLESEHRVYPLAVRLIAEGRVNIHDERAFIAGAECPKAALHNPMDG
ncbi:MAG: phosphoribosylglycinamide formyltransferase [Alphaproteobacteria bacterium]|nr:phosphoribosylglycinamide formyltransferase [Alphaproteobacteria bacterium]